MMYCYLQLGTYIVALAPPAHIVPPAARVQGAVLVALFTLLLLWVMARWSRAKGYSGWWGALGLLSLPGVIVLGCLPSKHAEEQRGFEVLNVQRRTNANHG